MYIETMRSGGSESRPAVSAGAPEAIDSSHGNAMAAPAPRSTVLRVVRLELVGAPPSASFQFGAFHHHRHRALRRRRRRRFDCHRTPLAIAERNPEDEFAGQRAGAVGGTVQRLADT